jgi:hypothetical protein
MDAGMTKEIWKGITVLRADDGAYITDGEIYTDSAYLGVNTSENDWRDATAEEYEAWQRAQEEPEPTAEDKAEAYDILMGVSE